MANSSSELSEEAKWELFRHVIYLVEGACIFVFNLLIFLTIYRHEALRDIKEYVCLAALALADALAGLGTISAALYRIPLWLLDSFDSPASGRWCLLTAHNFLWAWFDPAAHFMLVILSLDRVLSVAIPGRHINFTPKYMYALVASVYSISFVMGFVIYALNWGNTEPMYTRICWSSYAYGIVGSSVRNAVNAFATFASVGVYILVPILYRKHRQSMPPTGQNQHSQSAKFQKQLNKSVSTSCIATVAFVGAPWLLSVVLLAVANEQIYLKVSVWIFIVINLNPAVNLYIYYKKMAYFKVGFKALFKNKTLPPVLGNWQTS